MFNFRFILRQIFVQLTELNAKLGYMPFPKEHLDRIESVAQKLKQIVFSLRNNRPGNN